MAEIWHAILSASAMVTNMRGLRATMRAGHRAFPDRLAPHTVQLRHGTNDQRLPDVGLSGLAVPPEPFLAA
nr:hypothetical protein [Sphingopyxis sp. Root154]